MARPPPPSTLFPYTTLFRSRRPRRPVGARKSRRRPRASRSAPASGSRLRGRSLLGLGPREDHFSVADPAIRSEPEDRKSTRLNSSHVEISYAVFCLKKKKTD